MRHFEETVVLDGIDELGLGPDASDPTSATGEIVGMIPMIIVAMVLISWFIATLIFAFRHASGLRGRKLVIAVIIGIFVTEAVSKIILLVL